MQTEEEKQNNIAKIIGHMGAYWASPCVLVEAIGIGLVNNGSNEHRNFLREQLPEALGIMSTCVTRVKELNKFLQHAMDGGEIEFNKKSETWKCLDIEN